MTFLVGRLDHVAIAADDTVALAAWYKRILGLQIVVQAGPKPDQTQKTFLVGPSQEDLQRGSMIEIMPRNANPRHGRVAADPGISHIAWQVSDFDAAVAHLQREGVVFLGDIVQAVGGGRLISFSDCEANMIQIVERL